MNKQLLILPDTKRFNKPQTKELNDAGFVVVYLPDPSQARIITPEQQPVSASSLFLAAMRGVRANDSHVGYRALVDSMIRDATPPNTSGGEK